MSRPFFPITTASSTSQSSLLVIMIDDLAQMADH